TYRDDPRAALGMARHGRAPGRAGPRRRRDRARRANRERVGRPAARAPGAGGRCLSFLRPGRAPALRVHLLAGKDRARAPLVARLAGEMLAVRAGLSLLEGGELLLVDFRRIVLVAEGNRLHVGFVEVGHRAGLLLRAGFAGAQRERERRGEREPAEEF